MLKKIYLPFSILLLLSLSGLVIWQISTRPKIAYVSLNKVYNDFDLKKELEKKYTDVQSMRQKTLDSLELGMNILSRNLQNMDASKDKQHYNEVLNTYQYRRQEFVMKQRQFGQDNDNVSAQYSEQIWKQINQYVQEYGKEHDYTYIFGAADQGTLMYAASSNDITVAVTKYVNERYRGIGQKTVAGK